MNLSAACLLAFLGAAGLGQAADPSPAGELRVVGTLDQVRGQVERVRAADGQTVPGTAFMPLFEGDVLRLGGGASTLIVLDDGSVLKLDGPAEMTLDALRLSRRSAEREIGFRVRLGRLLAAVQKWKGSSKFSVKTPVMTIAIRGTDFAVDVETDTKVGVFEGQVTVQGAVQAGVPAGPEQALAQGQEAVALPGGEPAVQRFLSAAMERERRRMQVVRDYADRVRKRLAERDTYLQEQIQKQGRKIKEWEERRHRTLERRHEPR